MVIEVLAEVTAKARAKINLALHVTGQRGDGYHLLDSLVAFADWGDRLMFAPSKKLTLTIDGDHGHGLPSGAKNLIIRAARALHPSLGARITLEKNLPLSSGIGGGSADAAATLRGLAQLWGLALPDAKTILALGADVPVCLAGHAARMQGVGDIITPIDLPDAWLVLVNPGVEVSTAQVFQDLVPKDNPPLPPVIPPFPDVQSLAAFLTDQRNDLEYPAMLLCPDIAAVISELEERNGCLIARMSGSGATCFGLFADEDSAYWAARMIGQNKKHWWVVPTILAP